jgi:hypothetical protein
MTQPIRLCMECSHVLPSVRTSLCSLFPGRNCYDDLRTEAGPCGKEGKHWRKWGTHEPTPEELAEAFKLEG